MREFGMVDAKEMESMMKVHPAFAVPRPLAIGNDHVGFRYPRQQLAHPEYKVFREIEDIREIVSGDDAIHRFLSMKHEILGGRTGYHALQDKDGTSVVGAAYNLFLV